jgi:hypothetical protein
MRGSKTRLKNFGTGLTARREAPARGVIKVVTDEIIKHLLEAEDDLDWKDAAHTFPDTSWPETYTEVHYLYDESGRAVRKSRNLRGIREYVSQMPVQRVLIQELDKGHGGIRVDFVNHWCWKGRFASFGTLKWALRSWRNLFGAPLIVNGTPSGTVGYRNAALQEAEEDDFDVKEVVGGEGAASLADMKAAEPGFFSRQNNRWFGTEKVYKYGNFLVLKNARWVPGSFGQMGTWRTWTQYVIYEFVKTEDTPQGLMHYHGSANGLADAKAMIKAGDFRPMREQIADRHGIHEDDEESTKELLGGNLGYDPWEFRYEKQPKGYKLSIYYNRRYAGGEWFHTRNLSALRYLEQRVRAKDAQQPFNPDTSDLWDWLQQA